MHLYHPCCAGSRKHIAVCSTPTDLMGNKSTQNNSLFYLQHKAFPISLEQLTLQLHGDTMERREGKWVAGEVGLQQI